MIETVALVVATAAVTVALLAVVVWTNRSRLIRAALEAVRVERERERAAWTGRPRELLLHSGMSGDDPVLEAERKEEREREQQARDHAAKLEAGRVVRRERGQV